ncbi:MAG: lysylphosphatidylglycerol synthase transmembrane domain-containing protein [Candidatus Kapaibacteriota bacterium]
MKEISKNIVKILISVIFVVLSIYYATLDIDFNRLKNILVTTNFFIALIPIPIILLSHLFRAMRWKVMLNPIKIKISLLNLFSAVMIGYAANSVLPIPRAGEFLRPFVLSQREKVSFSSIFATIVIERVLDVIFLLFLFGVTFITLSSKIVNILPNDINPNSLITAVAMFVFIILVSFYPPLFRYFISKILKPLSPKIAEKISQLFDKFSLGLAVIKSPSAYIRLIIDSFAIWFLYAVPLYITFFAFDFQDSLNLGMIDALMLLIISGIGVSIAPTPGAIGVYHALVSTAMVQLYGIPKEEGLAYATVVHFVSYIIQVIVGGAFFLRENITNLDKLQELQESEK